MRDPVTGFDYPDEWVAKCTSDETRRLVQEGRMVLTSSGSALRRGFTTGTTAAAAAKAAVLSLGGPVDSVTITLPCGIAVELPVRGEAGRAACAKDAGDYPGDMTAGLEFTAEAARTPGSMTILFGEGVGRFVRDTPRYKAGAPAVSPPALSGIVRSVQEALDTIGESGITVRISVPGGVAVGTKTLNPKVGVTGGISILGTTGFVEPWDDHLTESTLERIAAATNPVLTTGRIGLRFSRLLFPDREVILIGGKLRESLAAARGAVTLCGLPALILRHIDPDILAGTGYATVEELATSPEFPAICTAVLAQFHATMPQVTVVLINRDGRIIGESR